MESKAIAAIGIDLGTTYSCVGVWQNDQVEIIANDQGNRTMPSCVAFTTDGRLIGEGAKNQIAMNSTNTIYDAKRLIGRRFNDAKLQEDMQFWPFKVIKGSNDIPKIVVSYNGEKKEFSAEEISSMVLMKLKSIAEAFLGKTVHDAVITVPAYFDDSQRQATKDAGYVAGLNVLRLINEPTSAAIAYGLDTRSDITCDTNVLIFDLGGGTFDVSLVTIDVRGKIKVKAVSGDTHLGGQDFDNMMVEYFVEQFNRKHRTNMSGNIKALGRLRVACEKAKRLLSSTTETIVELDTLHEGIDFFMRITRAKFENLNEDFFSKCIEMVENCLGDARMNVNDIDEVVLVGGSTRIPKVQELLKDFFNGKELCKRIHPDEAVAYGATILSAKLSGERSQKVNNLELDDVVPLSLGVAVVDGSLSVIIKRNTSIPTNMKRDYVTSQNNQSAISFDVYQGERTRAIYNNWLGSFEVLVPLAPKGMSKVEVVFEIDDDGILKCSGEETTTGLKRKIIISNEKKRLSKEEIKKMLEDAEKYRREDEEYTKKIFAYNALEEYIDNLNRKIEIMRSRDKDMIHKEEIEKIVNGIMDSRKILDRNKVADCGKYEKTLAVLKNVVVPVIGQLASAFIQYGMDFF
ncbi:unnamed protein product [Lactuca saligna]|uniref:Heat shock protein 70 n=1 Tax=Lactuca saligna TaxID=75948 RepID=A0AA35V2R6_LACSI|nr:unnamed protein product [Lactuca saligna]